MNSFNDHKLIHRLADVTICLDNFLVEFISKEVMETLDYDVHTIYSEKPSELGRVNFYPNVRKFIFNKCAKLSGGNLGVLTQRIEAIVGVIVDETFITMMNKIKTFISNTKS